GVLVLWGRSYSGRDYVEWTRSWREGNAAEVRYADLLSREGRLRLSAGWETAEKGTQLGDILLRKAQATEGKAIFTAAREEKRSTDYPENLGRWVRGWGPIRWVHHTGPVIVGGRDGVVRLYVVHWVMG